MVRESKTGVRILGIAFMAAVMALFGIMGDTPTAGAASGKFDFNSVDCDDLDKVPSRFRRIAERKCRENEPSFRISNQGNIADEPTPSDVYNGKDKKQLESMVLAAWKAKYPQDDVMGVRFHMGQWKRNENWKANATSIYKNDTSVLAVSMVVRTDADVATIFPAYLNKNNQTGGIRPGVDTKKSGYVVKQMLVKNYAP